MKTAIFILRRDTSTNKGEGEVYYPSHKGIIDCDVWNSPMLADDKIIIATGAEAISDVHTMYSTYQIAEVKR